MVTSSGLQVVLLLQASLVDSASGLSLPSADPLPWRRVWAERSFSGEKVPLVLL